jgi:hypothetical protein
MTAPVRTLAPAVLLALAAVGCQQRMADQPAHRPYETSDVFPDGQSARPLERGVIHRNQSLDGDPLVTWLTAEVKKDRSGGKFGEGAAADPKAESTPPLGAPDKVENFVNELPFEMTEADLKRGQVLYTAACALCHGAAGYGNGKIFERGFLRPPSYHADPAGKQMDWSTLGQDGQPKPTALPAGHSRGFFQYGKTVRLDEVPVGYIFQVISWGYAGMPAHDIQLQNPADRWRVVAYVRTLQLSQKVPEGQLSGEAQAELKAGGKK